MLRYVIVDGVDAFLTSSLGLVRGHGVGAAANTDRVT